MIMVTECNNEEMYCCENCIHGNVCRFKEDYLKVRQEQEELKTHYEDAPFRLELSCIYYEVKNNIMPKITQKGQNVTDDSIIRLQG